jgi:peptide-methionine (S)-S-oxide reductase
MSMFGFGAEPTMPAPSEALPGRTTPMPIEDKHYVLNTSIESPFPEDCEQIIFGLGCFWGAERKFWVLDGVYTTAVGYAAGFSPNPTYQEVCSGATGHNEVVLVSFRPQIISLDELLKVFWESHDPTQGMQQGNDRGTQYRSGVYYYTEQQRQAAEKTKAAFSEALVLAGRGAITTEIEKAGAFYYAEPYHQQYLAKEPNGYCGLGGTGVSYPKSVSAVGPT